MNNRESAARAEEEPVFESSVPVEEVSETYGPKGCVSKENIDRVLTQHQLQLQGGRVLFSAGAFGQLFLLDARNELGKNVKVVETTFTRLTQGPGKRYLIRDIAPRASSLLTPSREKTLPRERLGILDKNTGKVERVVIDLLYNEERALKELAGIPGIPESYGAVYEGTMGSSLKAYVDGYDLWFIAEREQSEDGINAVFDKVKDTYMQAAKKGFILTSPMGATVMVDYETKQPYITDWRYHSSGSIEADGPVKEVYEKGLAEIESTRSSMLEALRERLGNASAAA